MAPEKGPADRQEASPLNRRQYLLGTGALASGAGIGAASSTATAATDDAAIEVAKTSASDAWTSVQVTNAYSDPVVVAPTLSHRATDPASPRLRAVADDGFEVSVEEWRYLDGGHSAETAGYVVSEAGTRGAMDGARCEVGRVRTDHTWASVSFASSFSAPPIVFTSAQTTNGAQPVVTRNRDVSASGVDVRLQEEEAGGWHLEEDVGYLAIEAGFGELHGRSFEAGIESDVDGSWQTLEFYGTYERPVFLADMQTFRGSNTASIRYRNLTPDSVEVTVEEERSLNDETAHLGERIGYLVVEGAPTDAAGYGVGGYGAGGYGE